MSPAKNSFVKSIVKFHADLNRVAFTGFTKRELSIFYTLTMLLNDQGDREISISFNELRHITGIKFENKQTFLKILTEMMNKLDSGQAIIQKENGTFMVFTPFSICKSIPSEQRLCIKVNSEYSYLFNRLL